jgi:hypothetical protein
LINHRFKNSRQKHFYAGAVDHGVEIIVEHSLQFGGQIWSFDHID